jgi:putative NIF3 family GTP cyclohydrolase 1 type 2
MSIRSSNRSFPGKAWKRRDFLATMATLSGATLAAPGVGGMPSAAATSGAAAATPASAARPGMTIRQVIDALLADIPGAPFPHTVDTIKAGDPDQTVKGIVTTMFATDAVIERAASLGANFIIAHEPTFYNHLDETDWLGDDPVFRFKKDLLDRHKIVVWRFHDGIHSHQPDGIRMGVLQALGWEKYYDADRPPLVALPAAMPLGEIITHLKKSLDIERVKYIGDPARLCSKIVLSPGAAGGRGQIEALQKYQPDLFVCGELNEWETSEYVRDAHYQGRPIALVDLGHSVSEEPGMEWLIPVLRVKAPGIEATHVPSGDAFSWA